MGEAEFGRPFHQERYVVPDASVVEQAVLFGNHVFDDGALVMGEALSEPVDDSHQRFRFVGHPQSFGPAGRESQQPLLIPGTSETADFAVSTIVNSLTKLLACNVNFGKPVGPPPAGFLCPHEEL
jgi:hypothetical protein